MEPTEQKLTIKQNYHLAILVVLLCIVNSACCAIQRFKGEHIDFEQNAALFYLNMVLSTWCLLIERKYLLNFSRGSVIKFINWLIIFGVLVFVDMAIPHFFPMINKALMLIIGFLTLLGVFYSLYRFGNALMLIKNDFIGLLKPLGLFNIILVFSTLLEAVPYLRHNKIFILISYSLIIATYGIVAVIFYRAQKFSKSHTA